MKRIKVPDGMLKAIQKAWFEYVADDSDHQKLILEAALLWLSEHPQVPTDEQVEECRKLHRYEFDPMKPLSVYKAVAVEWQRRCFVQEEPEIPEEIKDLVSGWQLEGAAGVIEAYRRGLRKGEQK